MGAARHYGESRFHGRPFKVRIDFEVAEVLFGRGLFSLSVKRLQVGAGTQANLRDRAGYLRGVALAIGHGTGDRIDDDVLRAGIVLGAVGVWDVEDVAGEFDEGVLESSAGAEERPVAAAGELDPFEHAVETLEGAAGRGPQTVETFERFFGCVSRERRSGQPLGLDQIGKAP